MNLPITTKLRHFIMFHKPKGVIVTLSDEGGRKTVYDILPKFMLEDKWMPVGRLDRNSRGLLLFTQKGELTNLLTQPGQYTKIYEVWIRGRITEEQQQQTLKGVETAIGILKVNKVEVIGCSGPKTRLLVELSEGKNRHIRRVFGALKDPKFNSPLKVLNLKRTQIGAIKLDVPSSRWRFLTHKETKALIRDTAYE